MQKLDIYCLQVSKVPLWGENLEERLSSERANSSFQPSHISVTTHGSVVKKISGHS